MAALTAADLRAAFEIIAKRMPALEPELNEADGRLGDGDTGITLRRVFEKVAEASPEAPDQIGALLRAAGKASAGATGSSLGTLLAVALLGMGKACEGRRELPLAELGSLLGGARDAMMARGRAALGDKTVLDMLDAVARAIDGVSEPEELRRKALAAAREALASFRDRPCRIGRARMFGERSVGIDDPGMLAFARLVEMLAGPD